MKTRNFYLLAFAVSSFISFSQKDSVKYLDYYISINSPISRNFSWDIGVERIKILKKNISYSSMITLIGGKANSNFNRESYYNPKFLSICIQPFHLLYGKSLKFETGISSSFQMYRYKGQQYPSADSAWFYQDRLNVFLLFGIRYTLKKQQISFKFVFGPQYRINLQRSSSFFVDTYGGELGVNWRIRKKIRANQH